MKQLLDNVTVIDVRTPEEFSGNHFPDAINIPLNELSQRLGEIKLMKQPIVVYCRSGNRSEMAVSIMKAKRSHQSLQWRWSGRYVTNNK